MRTERIRAAAAATALLLGVALPAAGQEAIGDFYFFERADPDSGDDRSSVTTLADESYVSGAGGLTFRCAEDGLEMVLTATYLGRKMSTPVRFAFGEDEPSRATWILRSSGMAAIAPDDVREDFIQRAADQSTVVFHASDFQLRSHTYTFNLTGLNEALSRLSCR
jgi:hypothetical protein